MFFLLSLARYDLVITTYHIVGLEATPSSSDGVRFKFSGPQYRGSTVCPCVNSSSPWQQPRQLKSRKKRRRPFVLCLGSIGDGSFLMKPMLSVTTRQGSPLEHVKLKPVSSCLNSLVPEVRDIVVFWILIRGKFRGSKLGRGTWNMRFRFIIID